jgi:pentapeptide MXKDX repeat protein
MQTCSARRPKTRNVPQGSYGFVSTGLTYLKENNMKKLMTICFALALLTAGVASAQDTMQNDGMKADAAKKAVQVTGKISDDGKTFVSDTDSKSWSISNPDAVKGHEGHHVILKAHVDADKNEVHVMSLKMAK